MNEIEKKDFIIDALKIKNEFIINNFNKIEKEKEKKFFSKKKIALIVDVDNWAYANIARNFKNNIKKYDFKIIPMSLIDGSPLLMWLLTEDCNIIHFFCRGLPLSCFNPELKKEVELCGMDFEVFKQKYIFSKTITTCVYDHLFLDKELDFTQLLFGNFKNYYVSSNILYSIYHDLDIKYKPSCVITDGVNLEKFYPINIKRFDNMDRKIIIGWVGNSKWVNNSDDYKGINTIIKPAIKELQKEGYDIELMTSDSQDKIIPVDEMVHYYENIDIYICASKCEGTPNPVLESMACGIPIITTNVGIVYDALGIKQRDFILEKRDKELLKDKLRFLLNNRNLFKQLSNENLKMIEEWDWKYIAKKFEKFIDNAKGY